jgi:hypothetical protein
MRHDSSVRGDKPSIAAADLAETKESWSSIGTINTYGQHKEARNLRNDYQRPYQVKCE